MPYGLFRISGLRSDENTEMPADPAQLRRHCRRTELLNGVLGTDDVQVLEQFVVAVEFKEVLPVQYFLTD